VILAVLKTHLWYRYWGGEKRAVAWKVLLKHMNMVFTGAVESYSDGKDTELIEKATLLMLGDDASSSLEEIKPLGK